MLTRSKAVHVTGRVVAYVEGNLDSTVVQLSRNEAFVAIVDKKTASEGGFRE